MFVQITMLYILALEVLIVFLVRLLGASLYTNPFKNIRAKPLKLECLKYIIETKVIFFIRNKPSKITRSIFYLFYFNNI